MSPFEKVVFAATFFGSLFIITCLLLLTLQWAGDAICRVRGTMTFTGRRKALKVAQWYFGTADVHFKVKGNFCFAMVGTAVMVFNSEGEVISLPSDRVRQTDILKSL